MNYSCADIIVTSINNVTFIFLFQYIIFLSLILVAILGAAIYAFIEQEKVLANFTYNNISPLTACCLKKLMQSIMLTHSARRHKCRNVWGPHQLKSIKQ